MDAQVTPQRLATVKNMVGRSEYSWLTESAVRHLIHDSKVRLNSKGEEIGDNGLDAAIIRIGRKVLIDLDRFDQWIDSHRQAPS